MKREQRDEEEETMIDVTLREDKTVGGWRGATGVTCSSPDQPSGHLPSLGTGTYCILLP